MTENNATPKAGRVRKWGWGRWLSLLLGLLVVGVLGLYLLVSSSWFVKQMVVPRLSSSFNSSISVSSVSFQPFSGISLNGFRLNPKDEEWLINANEVSLRYDFRAAMGGSIRIRELSFKKPEINLIQQEDGTSNLDPILEALTTGTAEAKEESKAMDIQIQKTAIEDGVFRWRRALAGNEQQEIQFTNVDATMTDFRPDTSGQLKATSDVEITRQAASGTDDKAVQKASLSGRMNANYKFRIDKALALKGVNGNARFQVTTGKDAWKDLAGIEANIDTQFASNTVERFVSRFQQEGTTLGEIRIQGPLKPEQSEADLEFDVASLDQKALNLFGATLGVDFALAQLDGKGSLHLADGGDRIESSGTFEAPGFELRHSALKTPLLDIQLAYDFMFDLAAFELLLRDASMDATRDGRPLFSLALENPVKAQWNESTPKLGDSKLSLSVNELRLSDWQTAFSSMAPSGTVSLNATSTVTQNGDRVALDLQGSGDGLTVQMTTNRVEDLLFSLDFQGNIHDFESVKVEHFSSKVSRTGNLVFQSDGSGHFDLDDEKGEAALTFKTRPAELLALYSIPDLTVTKGSAEGELKLGGTIDQPTAKGRFSLKDFHGQYAGRPINQLFSDLDYAITREGNRIKLEQLRLQTGSSADTKASIELTGHYNEEDKTGKFAFTAEQLTEKTLSPWLAETNGSPPLPYGFSVNASGSTEIQSDGKQTFESKVDLSELRSLASASKGDSGSQSPLSAEIKLDGSWNESKLTLDPLDMNWPSTPQAENNLRIRTEMDLHATNAASNVVRIRGDSVDLTRWYDELYAGIPAEGEESSEVPPSSDEKASELPGPPWQLDAQIDRLYLRELVVTNLQTKATIEPSMLKIEPLKLALNGGSVEGRVQYEPAQAKPAYDLSFKVKGVPMKPLARSFSPASKWAYHGRISMDGTIAGKGFTGESLKDSLTGHFETGLSNGQIEVQSTAAKKLLVPISKLLRLPQLLQTPVHTVDVNTTFENGKIQVDEVAVKATQFRAYTEGEIPIASPLSKSKLDLPLRLELKRSLAEQVHLVPSDTPEDAEYIALPNFARINGTLASFGTGTNNKLIQKFILDSVKGLAGSGGEEASKVLKKFGDLIPPGIRKSMSSQQEDDTKGKKEDSTQEKKSGQDAIKNLFNRFLNPDKEEEGEQKQEQSGQKEASEDKTNEEE